MSLDFCSDIQMVASGFHINDMKTWIHPSLYEWFSLIMEDIL